MQKVRWVSGSVIALASATLATMSAAQMTTTPSEAAAQGSAASTSGANAPLGDIVVTAQKRSESVQRVAASVSVVGADDLRTRGVTDLRGITNFAPMVSLNPENVVTQIFIRGIGQTSDTETNDPAVATNIDGVYASRYTLSSSLFDVDRVEILSGPQGTLYGRNAAGGTVNVTTKLPTFSPTGNGTLEFGNYHLVHATAGLTTPLSDTLSIRSAFDANYHRGYVSNGQDDQDSLAARLTALYKPSSRFSLVLRGEYQNTGGNGASIILTPYLDRSDPWYQPRYNDNYYVDRKVYKGNGEFSYTISPDSNIVLTYIPSYSYYKFLYRTPIGYNQRYYPNPGVAGQPLTGYFGVLENRGDTGRQLTNELRLSGDSDKLHWILGFYAFRATARGPGVSFNQYNPAAFTGGPLLPYSFQSGGNATFLNNITNSIAGFGQATYSISDGLRVVGGLRYSRDRRHAYGVAQSSIPIANTVLAPVRYDLRLPDHRIDWKAGVEFDLAPDVLAYANAQTGYIGGGFNVSAAIASATTFRPEKVMAYTAGLKTTLLDRMLRLNVEGFFYDYKNLQVSAFNAALGTAIQQNVPKSRNYGIQVDATFRPARKTTLDGHFGYLNAKVKRGVLPPQAVYACAPGAAIPAALCSPGTLIDYAGNTLPYSPKWSIAGAVAQGFDLASGGELEGRVAARYQSLAWGAVSHLRGLDIPAYAKLDATLTYYTPGRTWSFAAWGKNLTNRAVHTGPATTNVYGLNSWFLDPPRTYGGRVSFQF